MATQNSLVETAPEADTAVRSYVNQFVLGNVSLETVDGEKIQQQLDAIVEEELRARRHAVYVAFFGYARLNLKWDQFRTLVAVVPEDMRAVLASQG